jgi:hypothetical protein
VKKSVTILILVLVLGIPMEAWTAEEERVPADNSPMNQNAATVGETSLLGENLSLTASFKVWQCNVDFGDDEDYDPSFIFGPSFNLTFREKLYAGINYYTGSGFNVNMIRNVTNDYSTTIGTVNGDGEYAKTDFDFWAGYHFHPRASVFLGYKYSKLEEDYKITGELSDGERVITISGETDSILKGPMVGINGNYPFIDGFFVIFGTFGYGLLTADVDSFFRTKNSYYGDSSTSDDDSFDLSGFALELGVSYAFHFYPKLSLTGGYKYQNYTSESDDNDDITFSGFTFGVNYRF